MGVCCPTYNISLVEVVFGSAPLFTVVADVCEAEQALELHANCSQVFRNLDALHEVALGLLHVSFEQVSDCKLAKAKRHALVVLHRK